MLTYGAVIWSLYSLLQLAVNGVVIDEVIMPAQIIAGAVNYPPGHPHEFVYSRLFSLPNYATALLWKVLPHPLVISGIRNFIYLFSSTMAVFSTAVLVTRKPVWGHFAVVLTITETFDILMGVYPVWIFPFAYSHGQIGLSTAVLIVVLLLAGCWRLGGLLLGLLPAIHAPMAAVVWPWSLLYFLFSGRRPGGRQRSRVLAWFFSGIAICVALGLVMLARISHQPFQPPYDVHVDGGLIHRIFTLFSDYHRQLFSLRTRGYFLNPLAFFLIGGLLRWQSKRQSDNAAGISRHNVFWLLLFGGVAWSWVYGAGTIHLLAGHLPTYIERLMPYRFSDITVLLLPGLTAAAIATACSRLRGSLRTAAVTLLSALLGASAVLLCAEVFMARLYRGWVAAKLLFIIWGALFSLELLVHRSEPRRRYLTLLLVIALWGTILISAPQNKDGILFSGAFLLGAVFLALWARIGDRLSVNWKLASSWRSLALLVGLILIATAALPWRRTYCLAFRQDRLAWDVPTQDDNRLAGWLAKNSAPTEMILSGLYPPSELQPKTGHPVLMEWETVYLMTYMPDTAPQIGMMLRDLFGVDYTDWQQASRVKLQLYQVWVQTWRDRRMSEWQSLSRKYHFRLVLSPADCTLGLPVAFSGKFWTLYTIPADATVVGNPSGLAPVQ